MITLNWILPTLITIFLGLCVREVINLNLD